MNTTQPLSRQERITLTSGIISGTLQLGVLGYYSATVLSKIPFNAEVIERAESYVRLAENIRLGNYLMTLPAPFFLLFLGGLGSTLRRIEGEDSPLALSAFGGGIAMAMLWPISVVVNDIGVDIAQSGGDAPTVAALDAIGPYMLALSALPRAVLLVAASLVLLETRVAPRWIAWSGLFLAGLSLLGSGTLVARSLFGPLALSTLLFNLWLIALGVALLRSPRLASEGSLQQLSGWKGTPARRSSVHRDADGRRDARESQVDYSTVDDMA